MQGRDRSLAWVLSLVVVACSARGNNPPAPVDAGTDTPPGTDTPVAMDVPVGIDVPVGTDVPVGIDVPVGTDVPVGIDRPSSNDVPAAISGPSQQIAAVRATPIGTAALRVDGVVVTYVVPATLRGDGVVSPTDPAGFFVQAERTGPALFVAVDPTTLTPAPTPGDRVGFTVTRISSPTPATHWAAEIGGYTRTAAGVPLGPLLQDVSGASDLVSGLLTYEDELITLSATVTSDFGAGGIGFLQASIATAALPADALLRLRIPIDVRTAVGLRNGCRFTINATPMWRFDVTAQASIWNVRDVSGVSCPLPMLDAGVDVPRDVGTPDVGTPDVGGTPGDDQLWVLRVGDGVTALTGAAVPVNIEAYNGSTGAAVGVPLALPTVSSGVHYPLTLSGTAGAEGSLFRSINGAWVVFGGYTLPVGTPTVSGAQGLRVIARINAAGVIDTRTVLGATVDRSTTRAVVTVDGSEFWSIHTTSSTGDVAYTAFGATTATTVTNREVFRGLSLFGPQLFTTGSNPGASGVYATSLLPRAPGATIALLPGFPLAMTLSPYGLVAFDRDGNGAADIIFTADDRSTLSGGGVQCWRLSGGTWSLVGNVMGVTTTMHGLTGRISGADYVLYGVTAEPRGRLLRFDVNGATLAATITTVAQAPLLTTYRGVAFAPR